MKQSPEMDRIQQRMRAGELTLHGFLGDDPRSLADIIAADAATTAALGFAGEDLAARLEELMEKGRDLAEREVAVEGRYLVTVRDDRGLLPSPFGDGLFGKGDCILRAKSGGAEIRYNALTLHMARCHGFYGGAGSVYRLDPKQLAGLLGLGA